MTNAPLSYRSNPLLTSAYLATWGVVAGSSYALSSSDLDESLIVLAGSVQVFVAPLIGFGAFKHCIDSEIEGPLFMFKCLVSIAGLIFIPPQISGSDRSLKFMFVNCALFGLTAWLTPANFKRKYRVISNCCCSRPLPLHPRQDRAVAPQPVAVLVPPTSTPAPDGNSVGSIAIAPSPLSALSSVPPNHPAENYEAKQQSNPEPSIVAIDIS